MLDSSMAYKKAIRKGGRIMSIHDTYKFTDGLELPISNGNLKKYSINEATSESSSFSVGATVIKAYVATLDNTDGKFDAVNFEGMDIIAKVGLLLPDNTTELIPKGRYRCVSAKVGENAIDIKAYDSMLFFDRPYTESTLVYPATILQIVEDACECCQMTFNAKTIQNGTFVVQERPDDSSITFRDVIGYCAQIMCCYAVIDKLDQLSFGWYDFATLENLQKSYDGGTFGTADTPYSDGNVLDGGNFTDYSSGDTVDGGTFEEQKLYHHLYSLGSQSINTEDICVSGIAVKPVLDGDTDEICLYGEDDYALLIEENPLIQNIEAAETIASYIGEKMVGKKFRPLSISCQSDPCIEAGDCACITDRKQRTFFTVITNTTFSYGSLQQVECTAETPTEKNYTKYGVVTKILNKTRKDTKKQLTAYDLAVQQLTNLMSQSFGVFKTEEKQEDGSIIYYMHNKPELASSSTIWKMTADAFAVSTDGGETWNAGMDSEGNAVVNVLSAIGINFDWAKGGTLKLGGADDVDGMMEIYNADGELVGKITKNGIELISESNDNSTMILKNDSYRFALSALGFSMRDIVNNISRYVLNPIGLMLYDTDGNLGARYTNAGFSVSNGGNGYVEGVMNAGSYQVGGTNITDHVIAQGTSGIWKYWKYNSGLAICYSTTVKTSSNNFPTGSWGSVYAGEDVSFGSYPFSFSETPVCHCMLVGADSGYETSFGWIAIGNATSVSTAPSVNFIRPDNKTVGHPKFRLVAIGRWK